MRHPMRAAFVTLLLLTAATSASALPVPPGQSPQSVDVDMKKDIERLLELSGSRTMSVQMASLVSTQLLDGLKRSQPNVPDRAIVVLKDVLDTELAKMFTAPDGIQQGMVELYAKAFTREDISALIAFYNSPVGRKVTAMMPQLAQDGAVLGKKWTEANMPRIMSIAQERLKAEGLVQ